MPLISRRVLLQASSAFFEVYVCTYNYKLHCIYIYIGLQYVCVCMCIYCIYIHICVYMLNKEAIDCFLTIIILWSNYHVVPHPPLLYTLLSSISTISNGSASAAVHLLTSPSSLHTPLPKRPLVMTHTSSPCCHTLPWRRPQMYFSPRMQPWMNGRTEWRKKS